MTYKGKYMNDDIDVLDNEEEESLNPDYDRVSGSGMMPSLDDLFGREINSDHLGSDNPFGGVIGDPAFADSPFVGGESPFGGAAGYDGAENETETEDEEEETGDEEDTEEEARVAFSLKALVDGSFLRSKLAHSDTTFIFVLICIPVLFVMNRNNAVSLIHDELKLSNEVLELRAESITIAAKLMSISKLTEVARLVQERKLGINEVHVPPMEFVIDKFYRADSLLRDMPSVEDRAAMYYNENDVNPER